MQETQLAAADPTGWCGITSLCARRDGHLVMAGDARSDSAKRSSFARLSSAAMPGRSAVSARAAPVLVGFAGAIADALTWSSAWAPVVGYHS